jgi:hypothetical protein
MQLVIAKQHLPREKGYVGAEAPDFEERPSLLIWALDRSNQEPSKRERPAVAFAGGSGNFCRQRMRRQRHTKANSEGTLSALGQPCPALEDQGRSCLSCGATVDVPPLSDPISGAGAEVGGTASAAGDEADSSGLALRVPC